MPTCFLMTICKVTLIETKKNIFCNVSFFSDKVFRKIASHWKKFENKTRFLEKKMCPIMHSLFYSSLTINKTEKASCPKYAARTKIKCLSKKQSVLPLSKDLKKSHSMKAG